jgi:hypothetical protein
VLGLARDAGEALRLATEAAAAHGG